MIEIHMGIPPLSQLGDRGSRRVAGRGIYSVCVQRMGNWILGGKGVGAKHLSIASVAIAVISPKVMGAIGKINCRQAIPWNAGVHMVDYVEVIVKKQKSQWAFVLDHDGPSARGKMGAMFEKCADADQRLAQIA